MPIPDYQALMLPVLEIAARGETSVPIAETELAAGFRLSDAERAQLLPSGKQRVLHNRIHWAKFYLSKAGYLESPRRGRFVITSAGKALLARPPTNSTRNTFCPFRHSMSSIATIRPMRLWRQRRMRFRPLQRPKR